MMRKVQYFLFLCLALVSASCLKEPQKPSWEVALKGPLFKASLGLQHFLADTLLESDSNFVLHLVYRDVLYDFMPDSIIETPDTVTYQNYQVPFSVVLQPGQLFINKNEEKVYKFGNSKITLLRIKNGTLRFEVSNSLNEAVLMTYTIASATKNGQVLEITELVPAAGDGGQNFVKMIDISGYTLNLKGSGGIAANTISTNVKTRLNPDGVATQITPQQSFNVLVKFEAFDIAHIKGYFEPVDISVNDESKMDVFSIIHSGNIDFEKINVDLLIENGFGIDARLSINEIISKNTQTGNEVPLHWPLLGQSLNVARAAESGNPQQPVYPTYYPLDFTYSNVKQMFENRPDRLVFDISGMTNPLGNISGGNDFYYDGHGLKIHLNLDIPLSLKTQALTLMEDFEFSMEKPSENYIKQGIFNLVADNGFPFDAQAQLYLYDEADVLLDSLIFNNTINAADVNAQAIVTAPKRTVADVPMPENKINKLYGTKKMVLKIVFDTHGSDYLKIYDFYKIDLKLTGDFDFMVQQ